jgi:RNA ligase (TIGR02306 family)
MSEFAVPVLRLDDVLPHDNADLLELAKVGGYHAVVPKGAFQKGDLVIYVPEASIVPAWILEKENLVGNLAGNQKNRVKAVKKRGELSQGLVLRASDYAELDDDGKPCSYIRGEYLTEQEDMSSKLGITKYEPPIPAQLRGNVGALFGYTAIYDIENIKSRCLFEPEEVVVGVEKAHGTLMEVGWCRDLEPRNECFGDGRVFVTSKGIAKTGLFIKNDPANADNLYLRAFKQFDLLRAIMSIAEMSEEVLRVYLFGEVFGDVQDLKYGHKPGEFSYGLFDVLIQRRGGIVDGAETGPVTYFVDAANLPRLAAQQLQLPTLPTIVVGKWMDVERDLAHFTSGRSLIAPQQIREGIVLKPAKERRHPRYGRIIAKSVSPEYLLRKGDTTEFN